MLQRRMAGGDGFRADGLRTHRAAIIIIIIITALLLLQDVSEAVGPLPGPRVLELSLQESVGWTLHARSLHEPFEFSHVV